MRIDRLDCLSGLLKGVELLDANAGGRSEVTFEATIISTTVEIMPDNKSSVSNS